MLVCALFFSAFFTVVFYAHDYFVLYVGIDVYTYCKETVHAPAAEYSS